MAEAASLNDGEGRFSALAGLRDTLRTRWSAMAVRERRLVTLGAVVLGLALLWFTAIAPAWRITQQAPAQLEALDAQLQQMQALAKEATTLRAVAPIPLAQAQSALSAATQRLGPQAKLSQQGERAVLALKGATGAQLGAWLAEARAGARVHVVEASLNLAGPGLYDGSLTLAYGGSR